MKRFLVAVTVAALAASATPAGANAAKKGAAGKDVRAVEPVKIELDVAVETLANGLKVILLEDHSVPVISYQTFFRVGSRNEVAGITGISHFMEHMMFNGAEKYGPEGIRRDTRIERRVFERLHL